MKSLAISLLFLVSTLAYAETVIYSFQGGTDGWRPYGSLIFDQAGNLYGTTYYGGNESCGGFGCGTVFELSPDGQGGWTETILYRFTGGKDGEQPFAGLILDGQGNLYGTTLGPGYGYGCPPSCGSVFELSPGSAGWKITVLHDFLGGNDGGQPMSQLAMDSAGNLYGTTETFGAKGFGVTYQISKNQTGRWNFRIIHTFTGGNAGSDPQGSPVVTEDGTIYGAALGGINNCGVLYSLSLNAEKQWVERVLYLFKGGSGGGVPLGLTQAQDGSFYGASPNINQQDCVIPPRGSAFHLTKNQSGEWTNKVIYKFVTKYALDPVSGITIGPAGNLFGFTSSGSSGGGGAVYELAPQSGGTFVESTLYDFDGGSDGSSPYGTPTMDASGNLYGVTFLGGNSCGFSEECGVVFEVTP